MAEREIVGSDLGNLLRRPLGDGGEFRRHRGGIDVVFPAALIGGKTCGLQLGKLGGDAALAHTEDFLKLRDRERVLRQQGQDPKPGGVGKQFQGFDG